MSETTTKYLLPEDQIPTHRVNLLPDLPGEPLPPLHPGTLQPAGPDDLSPIFPMALIMQEVSPEPEIQIPEEVREVYKLWRPTPLFRARRLERELGTPAHIYYKYEGVSPAGSITCEVSASVISQPALGQSGARSASPMISPITRHTTVAAAVASNSGPAAG